MKVCKVCNQAKPYDPTAIPQSKAAGFVGKVCWDCRIHAQRLRMQGLLPPSKIHTESEDDAKLRALRAKLKMLSKELSVKLRNAVRKNGGCLTEADMQEYNTVYQALEALEQRIKNPAV